MENTNPLLINIYDSIWARSYLHKSETLECLDTVYLNKLAIDCLGGVPRLENYYWSANKPLAHIVSHRINNINGKK